MALRAVRIQVGTDACFERRGGVGNGNKPRGIGERIFILRRAEHSNVVPRAKLVVSDAGAGVIIIAVELARFCAQHAARRNRVAAQTILPSRIRPRLRARAGGGGDGDVLAGGERHEVGVGIIRAPLVACSVKSSVCVAHQQPRFKPLAERGVRIADGQVKMFHEHRALRKRPFARAGIVDCRASGQRDPAALHGVVRPEGRIRRVGNEACRRRERVEIRERAGLREQRGQGRERCAVARQFVNLPADAAHLAEVKFIGRVHPERRKPGVIIARVWPRAARQRAERDFFGGRRGFIQHPDGARAVVAKDIFPRQIGGKFTAAINIAADDREAVSVRVVNDGPTVDANVRRRQIALQTLDHVPLKIQARLARLDHIHFLARRRAHVANENPSRRRVNRHPVRTPQAEAEKFLQRIRRADERVVVRDEIIRRQAVRGMLHNGMADAAAALIHVNAEHAGEKIVRDNLRLVRVRILAVRVIQKPVRRVKKHSAAIVPHRVAHLVNQHQLRVRDCHAVRIQREPREPVMIKSRHISRRPRVRIARHHAGNDPGIIGEHETVRREARMKRQPEQARIIPALALVVDVQHQFFFRHVGKVLK